jgi:hypothetical protein
MSDRRIAASVAAFSLFCLQHRKIAVSFRDLCLLSVLHVLTADLLLCFFCFFFFLLAAPQGCCAFTTCACCQCRMSDRRISVPVAAFSLFCLQHRKIAVSFRDLCLLSVFKVALVALRQLLDNRADTKLKEQVGILLLFLVRYICL